MDSIIFDVDGTLWDTTHVVADAWNEVVRSETSLDLSITPQKLKNPFRQNHAGHRSDPFSGRAKRKSAAADRSVLSERRGSATKKSGALYPQLESVLTQLAARLPLFLVSNCQAGYIETFLDCTGFAPYITDHLCPGDTGEGKSRKYPRNHTASSSKVSRLCGGTPTATTRPSNLQAIPFLSSLLPMVSDLWKTRITSSHVPLIFSALL